jgi:hypothetical protein
LPPTINQPQLDPLRHGQLAHALEMVAILPGIPEGEAQDGQAELGRPLHAKGVRLAPLRHDDQTADRTELHPGIPP